MIVVTGRKNVDKLSPALEKSGTAVTWVHDPAEFDGLVGDSVLIAYDTGLIVPKRVLQIVDRAYNFHAASPEFPGRDPHHWAIHRGAKTYGVTVHEMTEKVDDGPIVAVCRYGVLPTDTPSTLLSKSTDLMLGLFDGLIGHILTDRLPPITETWGPRKTTRADSIAMRGKKGFETF